MRALGDDRERSRRMIVEWGRGSGEPVLFDSRRMGGVERGRGSYAPEALDHTAVPR